MIVRDIARNNIPCKLEAVASLDLLQFARIFLVANIYVWLGLRILMRYVSQNNAMWLFILPLNAFTLNIYFSNKIIDVA